MKIDAEIDDEAFRVAEFIQELEKVQDEYFNKLIFCIDPEDLAEIEEFLFDYCFNGGNDQMFSEYVADILGEEND